MDGTYYECPNIVSCFMCCQTNTLSKQTREPATLLLSMVILRIATINVEKHWVTFLDTRPAASDLSDHERSDAPAYLPLGAVCQCFVFTDPWVPWTVRPCGAGLGAGDGRQISTRQHYGAPIRLSSS